MIRIRTAGAALAVAALLAPVSPALATETTSPEPSSTTATAAKASALTKLKTADQRKYQALAKRLDARMKRLQAVAAKATSEGRTAVATSYTTKAGKYPAFITRANGLATEAAAATSKARLKEIHRLYVALVLDVAKADKGLKLTVS